VRGRYIWKMVVGFEGFVDTSKLAPHMSLTQLPFRRDSSGEDETEGIPIVLTRFLTLSRHLLLLRLTLTEFQNHRDFRQKEND
jgi:hypothetical protein